MPTIVFVSPKGGVGKSTSALLLSNQLATAYDVTVIDADPNQPLKSWAAGGNTPSRLSIVTDVDENNILDRIEEAAAATPFVVVDLEGTAAKIVLLALSQADFAIIPLQASQLDAAQANRAIKVIRQREQMTRKKLPYAVLLTRTGQTIRTRTLTHIQKMLQEGSIPVLETELHEREAFRAVFSFQQTLTGLNPADVSNIDKAQANVEEFAAEILRLLASDAVQQANEKVA